MKIGILIVFKMLIWSSMVKAFPELLRHGYRNCLNCHSTFSGGDKLSPYGKSMAHELLSRSPLTGINIFQKKQSFETENPDPKDENAIEETGGSEIQSEKIIWDWELHLRWLQTHRNNSRFSEGRFFLMQTDMDIEIRNNEWQLYGSFGRVEPTEKVGALRDFVSVPRAWIQYLKSNEEETNRYSLRLGQFIPNYGIFIAEHFSVQRRFLNLVPGMERRNFELSLEFENYFLLVDLIEGRVRLNRVEQEKGLLAKLVWQGRDGFQIGINAMTLRENTNSEAQDKTKESEVIGVFGVLGWNTQLSQLFQIDFVEHPRSMRELAFYSKFSYEFTQGINFFTTQEYLNQDLRQSKNHFEAVGLGLQYFPAYGVDIQTTVRQEKNTGVSKEADSVIWILGHFYF